jgi:hypothetical protein
VFVRSFVPWQPVHPIAAAFHAIGWYVGVDWPEEWQYAVEQVLVVALYAPLVCPPGRFAMLTSFTPFTWFATVVTGEFVVAATVFWWQSPQT